MHCAIFATRAEVAEFAQSLRSILKYVDGILEQLEYRNVVNASRRRATLATLSNELDELVSASIKELPSLFALYKLADRVHTATAPLLGPGAEAMLKEIETLEFLEITGSDSTTDGIDTWGGVEKDTDLLGVIHRQAEHSSDIARVREFLSTL